MILEKLSGEKFTASEKQVVDFIQQYPRVVINLSLEELAAETFVSQASIIRLSKKLGAKGFADFKIQLAAELSTFAQDEKEIPVDIPIPEGCTTPDIARTFYNLSRQALDTTLHALDVIALQKAATLLAYADFIHLYGRGESLIVAEDFHYKLLRIGMHSQLETLNGPVEGLDKDDKLLIVCSKGKRAYFMQNRLRSYGYTNTLVLEGATFFNDVRVETVGAKVSPAEVTRVKALGFLWDKRTPDKFNGRVITRNGKLTAAEQMAVAQAAEKFGSGEVTMTSRLTLEIQGVPFANIEPLREYLLNAGLEMGGTGSKVRPVVSCKGTTCQYGLIDTFDLSQEIHERFYKGYHEVKLPHKFKIAVGGCPNNCVKPDLNDLGVIGQRIPQIQLDKCRGCKVCQIEETCPINVAKMENGKIRIAPEACNHCGRCVGKCPFKAVEDHIDGYRIYIGGRWGKKVAQGRYLDKVFTDRQEVLDVIEKAILLFREQGITGERFADTVARIGFEEVQRQLLDNELLARKEENLAAQRHMKGGATC